MDVLDLNEEQRKAIASLKRAIKKCEKANIGFFTVLDTTYAFNRKYVEGLEVDCDIEDNISAMEYDYTTTSFNAVGGCSFADDQSSHVIKLTDQGKVRFKDDY